MPRVCRDWARLSCTIILVVGLAAAVACVSHPPGHSHDHEGKHPPLCTDASNPVMLAHGKASGFLDGGSLSLFPKSLIPIMALVALNSLLFLALRFSPEALCQSDTRTSVSPPMFIVVLLL
jgi:hypothetical protein